MRFPITGVRPLHGLISLALPACLIGSMALAIFGLVAPGARAAFGVEKWEAGTCKESSCNIEGKDPAAEFFTQAAGHPNFGITNFSFNYKKGALGVKEPEGRVKDVRVDLPPGLAVDPEAVEQCPEELIVKFKCPPASKVGEDEATGTAELTLGIKTTITEKFPVFDVQRQPGEPARFGVEVESPTLTLAESATGHKLQSVIYLDGGISWYNEATTSENSGVQSGDFHEFFKIQNIAQEPEIVESKLIFWGVPHEQNSAAADNTFLTMPSSADACAQPQTTWLHVASYEDPSNFIADPTETRLENGTPLTATGCDSLAFNPELSLKPATSKSDEPDGATVDLHIPQTTNEPSKPNSPDVQSAEVTLPEGMTLNPSAAHGLEACSDAQIAIGTNQPIGCPPAAKIGTVTIDAPGIPNGALSGGVYVGTQESQEPESGKEYRIFLAAEAPSYGVGVRLEGHVYAKEGSGQLRAVFDENPQVPFEDVILQFNGGPRAPLANPLSCGPAVPVANITPYSGQPPKSAVSNGFAVGSGTSAPCASPLPFSLAQSTTDSTPMAGALTSFTLNLTRDNGQQYLAKVRTVLPAGLLGAIPSVPLCGAAQAAAGTCAATSEIGKVTVTAGSGSEPYAFAGHVYLTGPYEGAPYGLSIVVPAVAGPFNLGNVVTRAAIGVEQYSGRVVVTAASIPQTKGGVPLRLRTLSVAVNRPHFLFNPTNCSALASETGLTSAFGATQALSTPFQVMECSKLPFTPSLSAYSGAKPSRVNGASLEVKITQGKNQANLREVQLQLPKRLPSRVTTLRKACAAATFEAGPAPGGCTDSSKVGSATVTTPVLPGTLTGPAYLVSHGGEAFPDLDLILRGDGVQVVLVGHTHISTTGITTSTFETLPDVPISSAVVDLPMGPQSVLSANGSLCNSPLTAPTTLVAQSGAKLTQQTTINVRDCPFAIVSHRTSGRRAILKVRVPAAGRLTVSGHDLRVLRRRVGKATTVRLVARLTRAGVRSLHAHKRLQIRLRVAFAPRSGHHLSASTKVTFRRS